MNEQQQPTVPPADDPTTYPPEPEMFTREWFTERGFERGRRVADERTPERFGTVVRIDYCVVTVQWDDLTWRTTERWLDLAPLGYSAAI